MTHSASQCRLYKCTNIFLTVHVDGMEGTFVRQFESHHDHAGHPEEQNVITGFQHSGRIESSCSLEVLPKSICHFS